MNKTIRYDCYYVNELNHKDRVQVEFYIAHDKIISAKLPEKKTYKSGFIESQFAYLRVYSFEDLFARKIVACLNRIEGKDIYDLVYCFERNFDKNIVEQEIGKTGHIYGLNDNPDEIIANLIQKLNSIENQHYIGTSTNHFIPRNLRPDWKMMIVSLVDKLKLHFQK